MKKILISIDEALASKIKKQAEKNSNSLTGEIRNILDLHFSGFVNLKNKPVDRITKKQNKPRKWLSKERIEEMVRINEAKIKAKKESRLMT